MPTLVVRAPPLRSIKFVSFVMVTIGLFLCTVDDSKPTKRVAVAAAAIPSAQGVGQVRQAVGTAVGQAVGQAVAPMAAMVAQRAQLRRRL